MRGPFLGISKAFDKVWYEGLIFKLQTYGINGKLLNLIQDYLHSRPQRIVLNGQKFSWGKFLVGALQGPVLGQLLFLIYINNIPEGTKSICKIFAMTHRFFQLLKKTTFREIN